MDFSFWDLDIAEKLTRCRHPQETCPAPMSCVRRNEKRTQLPSMDLHDPEEEDCLFYVKTEMISDQRHIFRGGQRRHNKHVAKGPDLMVKRHIRSGKDINDG